MTEETYEGKYCSESDVLALFGDISDNPSSELIEVAIDNTEAWIESNLKRHYVPTPTNIPQALKTVAIYYACSDILMSLYHGEEYQSLMDARDKVYSHSDMDYREKCGIISFAFIERCIMLIENMLKVQSGGYAVKGS
jgi:hypothetical protein